MNGSWAIRMVVAVLAVAGTSRTLGAAGLTLVENGAPRAAIVVAADEPKADRAAAELQKYIARMSGATLPLVKEGEAVTAPVSILVGHTRAAAKLKVKIPAGFDSIIRPESFEEEGYVLKTTRDALVVAGNSDAMYEGTLYAAYAR